MSLREHLDRYCLRRAMASDLPPRSRSPITSRETGTYRPSPFFAPPGWQPPTIRAHRPVIIQIDLKPIQHLALRYAYYNILAPQVAGNLSTSDFDGIFTLYQVIYIRIMHPATTSRRSRIWLPPPSPSAGPFASTALLLDAYSVPTARFEQPYGQHFFGCPLHYLSKLADPPIPKPWPDQE